MAHERTYHIHTRTYRIQIDDESLILGKLAPVQWDKMDPLRSFLLDPLTLSLGRGPPGARPGSANRVGGEERSPEGEAE